MNTVADVTDKTIAELLSLRERAAVVTGGGQGLGAAIARRLVEAGADVLVTDRDESRAMATAEALTAGSAGRVVGRAVDVADTASVEAAVAAAQETFGGVDIWINNAGVFPSTPLAGVTDAAWDEVMAVNARGTFAGIRAAARAMEAQGRGGVIVNVASLAGLRGIATGLSAYVASKHAVVGLTRQLAVELAPQRIRVLAVAPGFMVTEGNTALIRANPQMARMAAEEIAGMFSSKLGRVGVADDIARTVLFCASDMSIFMTGTTITVDAGETA